MRYKVLFPKIFSIQYSVCVCVLLLLSSPGRMLCSVSNLSGLRYGYSGGDGEICTRLNGERVDSMENIRDKLFHVRRKN